MLTGGKLADLLGRRLIFMTGLVDLHRRVARLRARAERRLPDRRARRPGARRRADEPGDALDHHRDVPAAPARHRDRDLGGRLGDGARDRPARRRVLTEHVNWNWIFFINVPIGIIGLLAAPLLIDESRDTSREQRPDVPGLVTSGIGLFALTLRVHRGQQLRLDVRPRSSARSRVAAVALGAFVLLELRQRLPMLELVLFRNRTFSGANVAMLFVGLAMFGTFFYVSLYMQNVLGYSPVQAGASFLPMTVLIILIAPRAGKLSDRVGSRWLVGGGMTLLAIMLLYYSTLGAHESFWAILPGLLLGGDRHGLDDDAGRPPRR